MSLPTDSQARKEIPMFSGLLKYFPDALAAVANHSYVNNEKHNPGQPLHWSREKSSDHLECCVRHLTDIACGADKIEELRALAWRALAELQLSIEAKQKADTEKESDLVLACFFCEEPIRDLHMRLTVRGHVACSSCFQTMHKSFGI